MSTARSTGGAPLLDVRDVSVEFQTRKGVARVLESVSFALGRGETLGLVGESGCGKSMTALAIMRLIPTPPGRITAGSVRFEGTDLLGLEDAEMRAIRGNRVSMIFQEPMTSLNPVYTVGEQIAETVRQHEGLSRRAAMDRAAEMLSLVHIPNAPRRVHDYPHQFSGGMRQRVMIAMALACKPKLLIADEPTTALDVTIQAQILDLLRRLQAERGMGLLLITHDLGVVSQMAHRVGVMYAGEIVEEAPRDTFFTAPLHPYTQKLFAALPELSRRGGRLETIAGQVPALSAMPSGCRFAERCPHAWARCRDESPGWHDAGGGHRVRCHLLAEPGRAIVSQPKTDALIPPLITPESSLLTVENLRVHFPIRRGVLQRTVGHVKAVDGVSLELLRGRTLALVGESGCGKTTVGKAILQLIQPTGGSVRLEGRELNGLARSELRPLRRRLQMIFQDPFASLNPRFSVGEIIGEGMSALALTAQVTDKKEAIAALLQQVGLDPATALRYPHEFSGGQRQRIAIARALAVQPELIVCDEPTLSLIHI